MLADRLQGKVCDWLALSYILSVSSCDSRQFLVSFSGKSGSLSSESETEIDYITFFLFPNK